MSDNLLKQTAAQRRFIENVTLIAASKLIFYKLEESGIPLYKLVRLLTQHPVAHLVA